MQLKPTTDIEPAVNYLTNTDFSSESHTKNIYLSREKNQNCPITVTGTSNKKSYDKASREFKKLVKNLKNASFNE